MRNVERGGGPGLIRTLRVAAALSALVALGLGRPAIAAVLCVTAAVLGAFPDPSAASATPVAAPPAAVDETLRSLTSALGEARAHSQALCDQSGFVNAGAGEVAAAVEEAVSGLRSAMDEVHRYSDRAETVARKSVDRVATASTAVAGLVATMDRITNTVAAISSVAEKTNLLALNAAIEAARAGEAGRGFAVVASEVKDLASTTSAATVEIAKLTEEIQIGATAASETMASVAALIGEMHDCQLAIAGAVSNQDAAAENELRSALLTAESTCADLADRASEVVVVSMSLAAATDLAAEASAHLVADLTPAGRDRGSAPRPSR